jgi:hypothetical protein
LQTMLTDKCRDRIFSHFMGKEKTGLLTRDRGPPLVQKC